MEGWCISWHSSIKLRRDCATRDDIDLAFSSKRVSFTPLLPFATAAPDTIHQVAFASCLLQFVLYAFSIEQLLAMTSSSVSADSESQKSTPASSPPPVDMDESKENDPSGLQAEEAKMRSKREKEDAERDAQLEKERQEDLEGGKEILDKKFQQLEFLMNKSKVSVRAVSNALWFCM